MATPFLKIYDAFLARITADEWMLEEELAIVERDWQELLKIAVDRFKYPRIDLTITESENQDGMIVPEFTSNLTNAEIQLLALYMKHEWIKRCLASWEEIRQLYVDSDYSQANHLDKLLKLESQVALEVHKAEGRYDRAHEHTPASTFKKLAGKRNR